jgi:phenylacetate-coenzyme A ligase PaaK-like adenylate-forming protein
MAGLVCLQGRFLDISEARIPLLPAVIEDSIRQVVEVGDEFRVEISRIEDLDKVKVTIEPSSQIPKSSYQIPRDKVARALKGFLGISVDVEVVPYGSASNEIQGQSLV